MGTLQVFWSKTHKKKFGVGRKGAPDDYVPRFPRLRQRRSHEGVDESLQGLAFFFGEFHRDIFDHFAKTWQVGRGDSELLPGRQKGEEKLGAFEGGFLEQTLEVFFERFPLGLHAVKSTAGKQLGPGRQLDVFKFTMELSQLGLKSIKL